MQLFKSANNDELIKAVNDNVANNDDLIMLYITGGGEEKFKRENDIIYLKPKHIFDITPDVETVKDILDKLFKKHFDKLSVTNYSNDCHAEPVKAYINSYLLLIFE